MNNQLIGDLLEAIDDRCRTICSILQHRAANADVKGYTLLWNDSFTMRKKISGFQFVSSDSRVAAAVIANIPRGLLTDWRGTSPDYMKYMTENEIKCLHELHELFTRLKLNI